MTESKFISSFIQIKNCHVIKCVCYNNFVLELCYNLESREIMLPQYIRENLTKN